jgi:hypothetical protein
MWHLRSTYKAQLGSPGLLKLCSLGPLTQQPYRHPRHGAALMRHQHARKPDLYMPVVTSLWRARSVGNGEKLRPRENSA